MTTNALMELADRLDAWGRECEDLDDPHSNIPGVFLSDLISGDFYDAMKEAATQLRTAAAEGGEAVATVVSYDPIACTAVVRWVPVLNGRPPFENGDRLCLSHERCGTHVGTIVEAPNTEAEWTELGHALPPGTKLYPHPPTDSGAGRDGELVAEITGVDEYGPMLSWHKHWVDAGIGTKLYAKEQP